VPQSPRLLRPRATGFDPRSISGLALWLDASDASSLYTTDAGAVTAVASPLDIATPALWLDGADSSAASMTLNGSLVETWKDKSGNGRDFTATSTARPTLTASAINSRSAVTFNGSSTTMTGNAAAENVIRNLAGYTIFTAIRTASVAGGERFAFGVGSTVLVRTGQQDSRPFIGGRRLYADTLESITDGSGALTTGATFIQAAVVNHSSQSLTGVRNGAAFATDATYMGAGSSENVAAVVSIGTQAGGTYGFWNGDIAEVIVYPTALTTADRARVEAYLAAKWGISGVHAPATATNDPVGAWLDKSGNARHATQATGASRPRIASATTNGRKVAEWHSSTSRMQIASTAVLNDSMTLFAVAKRGPAQWGGGGGGGYGSILNEAGTGSGTQLRVENGVLELLGGSNKSSFTPSGSLGVSSPIIISGAISSLATSLLINGAVVDSDAAAGSAASGSLTEIGAYNASTGGGGPLNAEIAELITYSRAISLSERQRLERYLAAKWGITLAPQVSNADAQNWIDRVYANGGTVSASTASAVNQFCSDIDSAGIRDRFYRMGIFAGTGLNACLVPLYRGPSLGGTQYGGTTDTNWGPFVSGDYVETGASGGLTGNGTSKYLTTGLTPANLPDFSTGHLSVYSANAFGGSTIYALLSSLGAGYAENYAIEANRAAGGLYGAWGKGGTFSTLATQAQGAGNGHTLIARTSSTDLSAYRNTSGTAIATSSTSVTPATSSSQWAVFAHGTGGSPLNYAAARLGGYSIGASMTGSQAAAFYTAMQAFQTAMGRNV
jgi:hypothetical protein